MKNTCTYCNVTYTPRAQVKNPVACNNSTCQKKRQRDNEKAWRQKNKGLYDNEYHKIKCAERYKNREKMIQKMVQLLIVGIRFSGAELTQDIDKIYKIFMPIGIRQLNKLFLNFNP